ncbi:hypothetical protein [uncultured Dokdonia sp.]|uniref:hypothetical protein n=1 Tax=uncultured Dokdonia sp. TaxID=575653 RepID=UPI002635B676|nr:hypothetical protein [uncultured Dokdonia sp.]
MKKAVLILCVAIGCLSCGSSNKVGSTTYVNGELPMFSSENIEPFLDITEVSEDATYGYSEKNPIMIGGGFSSGASNQRRYFASLAGPDGETVRFVRLGSCCGYESENAQLGGIALLDKYQLTYEGLKEPFIFYISLYDEEMVYVPKGLSPRKN